jgi:hypothetical protein
MTTPQDPNQVRPEDPGWAQPAPGWDAPGQATPGAPPAQPGWGTPPATPPPGWGAPPAGGPPPGWGTPPPPAKSSKKGCFIAIGIVLAILVVLVGGCAVLIGPIVGTQIQLQNDLGSRVESVEFNWVNGESSFNIYLAPGHDSEADYIACQIVRPDIARSSTPDARFTIYSSLGSREFRTILADETTPCD